ncbi:1,3-beta-glucan synthase subunit FKS1-like protein [Tanacetum coccineum]
MHQTISEALWTIWESPEFIAKSDRGRVARQSNKRLHVGGSVSIAEHKRRLVDISAANSMVLFLLFYDIAKGTRKGAAELFFQTHMKKYKTFVDNEAKETWYGAEDSLDKKSGNIVNTYIRWWQTMSRGRFKGDPMCYSKSSTFASTPTTCCLDV